jgi:general secretion pathway protein D
VLDVQPIVSADKKYITLTVRPTNAEIVQWRRFGRPDPNLSNNGFGGGQVVDQTPPDTQVTTYANGLATTGQAQAGINNGETPLMIPVISYQAVRTSVTIPDGGSIMLAGMNSSASKRSHTGVPFLSHIPFLGRLFSTNGRNEREMKILIVLQADVVLYEEIEKKL